MTEKQGKLVNPSTGEMRCKICGGTWWANVQPDSGGKFYRGSWQCPHCAERKAREEAR